MITRQLISAIILSALSTSVIAENSECNTTNNLNGWGVWCGIDTFLGQQEPTAAGGSLFNPQGLSSTNFDADELGGKFTPIKNEEDIVIGWVGYATISDNSMAYMAYMPYMQSPEQKLGTLKVDLDREGQVVKITGLFEDGSTLDLGSDYFYDYGYSVDAGSDYSNPAEYFYSYFYGDRKGNDSSEIYRGGAHGYDGNKSWNSNIGKATSMVDISNLKNIDANYDYQVHAWGSQTAGQYSSYTSGNAAMNVNFGTSTWSMDNLHGFDSKGKVSGNTFKSTEIKGVAGGMVSPVMVPYPGGNSNFSNHTVTSGSSINGVFIGSDAKGLIGQTNITAIKDGQATVVKTIMNGSRVMNNMPN